MAKFHFASDLHLDIGHTMPEFPGGKLLILAGDTCEARCLKKYNCDIVELAERDQNFRNSDKGKINLWFKRMSEKYDHIVMVPGNHEFYGGHFKTIVRHMRDSLPENVHVLDNDCFEFEDIFILGGTLWTDMNKQDPMTLFHVTGAMNDYSHIRMSRGTSEYARLKPKDTVEAHIKTLSYFKMMMELEQNKNKKIVIVTHHAPSWLSVPDYYKGDFLMNGAYVSGLEEFILDRPQIKIWIHGHTHDTFDYMIGDHTRVLCNPRGYQYRTGNTENDRFNPNWETEV